ncbi:amino acid adenylation domain-containing protein [Nocardiaceae bacterium YC2-7]|uniref:Amino acid adenylation domain-containing protein n=1 Tax=Antrihabitans stalactiti TaxID=2584121 RepID=A0A848KK60_9NOCA|nr:non-ribosomal peptide synthetase [Antrihabitans stalactiti]NMN98649.1 amino acid adenylation domain-containing protein [Antrihabitans stalactiti]
MGDGPPEFFPLSSAQRGMWFAQQLTPQVPFTIAQYVELRGELDVELLRAVSRAVAHEFESAFLRLIEVDGEPLQMVDHSIDYSMSLIDFQGESDPRAAAQAWVQNNYSTPLNVRVDLLFQSSLLQVGRDHYLWYCRGHHVAVDGFGAMTMLNRAASLYTAAIEGDVVAPSRAADLRTLCQIDQQYRSSSRFIADRAFWTEHLTGISASSTLANTSPAPAAGSSSVESTALSEEAARGLEGAATHLRASPAAVVIAGFALYVSRMTGKADVQISIPVSARTTSVLRSSAGMLTNVAPLRLRVQADDLVGDLVERVQLELMGALRHQRYSIEDIRRDSPTADISSGLLVNVMLFRQQIRLGSLMGEFHIVSSGPVDDLLVNVYYSGTPSRTVVDFLGNPNRYSTDELRTHHRGFVELVEEFSTADPDTPLADIHAPSAAAEARAVKELVDLSYWVSVLSGVADVLALPTDRPRPMRRSLGMGGVGFEVGDGVHRGMVALARTHDATVFMVAHAVLAVLLARSCGTADVVIGTPVAGQRGAVSDELAKTFVNAVVLRTAIDAAESFSDLLGLVRETDLGAFGHTEVPFERVVEALDPARSAARSPLFQVMLVWKNVATTGLDLDATAAQFDLQLTLVEHFDSGGAPVGIVAEFGYATDLFDAATVAGFAERFGRILESVVADPAIPVGDVEVLGAVERERILAFARGGGGVPARLWPELLSDAVVIDPDAIALSCAGIDVSYRQLDDRSSRLARVLIRYGAGPETCVALGLVRSIESVLAMWAIAKSGAALVPVDPNYPAERIGHMLADCGAVVGVTVGARRAQFPDALPWLELDEEGFEEQLSSCSAAGVTDADRLSPLRIDNPAYLIYTSGSTGVPKGVAVTHRGLADLVSELRDCFMVTPQARVCHSASPSFDIAVFEMMIAVSAGATLVIVEASVGGGEDLARVLQRERVTHGFLTPSVLMTVDPAGLEAFGTLMVGGEVCPSELVARWAPGRRMLNGYGPTETTIMSNHSGPLKPGEPITLGGPTLGFGVRVLDSRLHPVPVGAVGELYLSGPGLARGYHRRPLSSAARFVADPFGGVGARMYRTGDVARWNARGQLEYVGRSDFQVKVRGVRVEPGEIDAVLAQHCDVGFAVTVAHPGPSGETALVSYVLPIPGAGVDTVELTAHVAGLLPAHMVPAKIVVLEEIPLTPVGKLDRKALPPPEFGPSSVFRSPSNPTERAVADVFAAVLGVERVGSDDNFFDLGGNSLTATRTVARVNAALGTRIGVLELFDAPTVQSLAVCADSFDSRGSPLPLLTPRDRRDPVPVSLAQERMWFLNQFDTSSAAYNIPIILRLSGALDVEVLRMAVADVIERHEPLRTVYPLSDQGPIQVVLPLARVDFGLSPIPVSDHTVLREGITRLISDGFDVTVQVPLRFGLFEVSDAEHVLAVTVHHICGDGFSMGPLARDVSAAYRARIDGKAPGWEPLAVQYADYSLWQRELLGSEEDPGSVMSTQLSYWVSVLSGAADVLALPTDRPRPARRSLRGAGVRFEVGADVHRGIVGLARAHDATVFMVAHAVLAVLLARLCGTGDVVIGTPVAGRGVAALDELVGMFVNTVVLRTGIDAAASFTEVLRLVRETDLGAFGHADAPFERVVEAVDPARSTARSPLFQVMLVSQSVSVTGVDLPGVAVDVVKVDTASAQLDLQLVLTEHFDSGGAPAGIEAEFGYATDLFDAATVADFAERFTRIVESALTDPSVAVGDIEVLGSVEREQILALACGGGGVPARLWPELLSDAVVLDPDAVALSCAGVDVSYRELDDRSNRLARVLIENGAGPERFVALGLPRSIDSVVAMWAVAKSGAALMPVDPNYPADRIGRMLADSGAVVGVTVWARRAQFPSTLPWVVLDEGGFEEGLSSCSGAVVTDADRLSPLRIDHPAYLIYTSGSTGVPKGVAVTHRGLADLAAELRDCFLVTCQARVSHCASPSFDISVFEMMIAVSAGATLVIVEASVGGGDDLARVLDRDGVTHGFLTPSVLMTVDPAGLDAFGTVMVGGEGCPAELVARWAPGRRMLNGYGPTEATVMSNHSAAMTPGEQITLGGPTLGFGEVVLDSRLRPVPVGVVGELYLSGPGLARGYHRRPGPTAARFVANPFDGVGGRMYRTGDVVRWNARGEVEYVGRSDFQVKVRGLRVEPGEIDAVLARHDDIGFAVTMAQPAPSGEIVLVSYVLPIAGAELDSVELTAHAAGLLPAHMVPAKVVVLEEIPLTPVGKLDRKALPRPEFGSPSSAFRAPRNPTERAVAEVFATVLGVEDVGIDDNFFDLGGNSLSATRMVARVKTVTGAQIPVQSIYTNATPESLARRIDNDRPDEIELDVLSAVAVVLPMRTTGLKEPLFCIHPAIGLAWCFTGLVRYLDDDQPIYGIQSPALTDPARAFDSLEDLAHFYARQIRAVQPCGPYHLLGYSVGGQIAHAIAVELGSDGDEVSTLAIMDSLPTSATDVQIQMPTPVELLAEFGGQIDPRLDNPDITVERASELLRRKGGLFAELTPARLDTLYGSYTWLVGRALEHRPSKFDGDLLFFSATPTPDRTANAAAAWKDYVAGQVLDHRIACRHERMTSPDGLEFIGPVLAKYLDASRRRVLRPTRDER